MERVRAAMTQACRGLVERENLVELVVLGAVAQEHLLVVGPPGTAKSEAVRRIAQRLGGRTFEYLLGRFTEPSEIFGPVDLRKLREGVVETATAGMLPEADIAFLDEIFLGSTAILNSLLSLLNERTFRRGHTAVRCPLRLCVGAANRLPDDEQLAAFADRFLLRAFVEPIADSGLEELLAAGDAAPRDEVRADGGDAPADGVGALASLADLDELAAAARALDLAPIRATLAHAIRLLRGAGVELSDRRLVRVQRVIAAAAALAGRARITAADLWPLILALPTARAQELGREVLRDVLVESHNPALLAAAAYSSASPGALGGQLLRRAELVFAQRPTAEAELPGWRLRVEALGRELDATFAAEALPAELTELRAQVVDALKPASAPLPGLPSR